MCDPITFVRSFVRHRFFGRHSLRARPVVASQRVRRFRLPLPFPSLHRLRLADAARSFSLSFISAGLPATFVAQLRLLPTWSFSLHLLRSFWHSHGSTIDMFVKVDGYINPAKVRRKLHTPHPPSLLCSRSSSCALSSLLSLPQPLWVRHVPPRLHPSRRTGMLTSPTPSVPYPTVECSTPQPWHQRRVRRCFGANAVQLCSVLVCWFHGRALGHGSPVQGCAVLGVRSAVSA